MSRHDETAEAIRRGWQESVRGQWHEELEARVSEVELGALYSCIPDCYEEFQKIYSDLLPALLHTSSEDVGGQHDLLADIGGVAGRLEHIKDHIVAARKAFDVILRLLAERSEPTTSPPEQHLR
jgi:hypothetical protein